MDLGGGGIKALASLLKDAEAESDSEDDQVRVIWLSFVPFWFC